MPAIVLTTLNAKYIHTSFGLRYLQANLGDLKGQSLLLEFTIQSRPIDIVQDLLDKTPRIIGIGVYIWNATLTLSVVRILKKLRPDIAIILGGPEVSYEHQQQELCQLADFVVSGEGERVFASLCHSILEGDGALDGIQRSNMPDLNELVLPYGLYSDEDIAHRVIYVEASRGCPFRCQFCLSALDQKVRTVQMERFLGEMKGLLDRGVRRFKFVDRTFNLAPKVTNAILRFFTENYVAGLFLHFEMIPDRFPAGLKEWIAGFPPGTIQLEVGIQTFNPAVAARIERRQDMDRIESNLTWLLEHNIHLHTDLIIGLPGEGMDSFGAGFDRLIRLGVQEVQVGILKRLRGAPIARHTEKFDLIFSPEPPYDILQSVDWTFEALARMRRFARYWDMVGNSGRYTRSLSYILGDTPFQGFLAFSDWLYSTQKQTHKISAERMLRLIFDYFKERPDISIPLLAEALAHDYCLSTKHKLPPRFLRSWVPLVELPERKSLSTIPERQSRHLSGKL